MSEPKEFAVGDRVRIIILPPYVKTAESMPMLRPPNVISLGEEGTVMNRRPGNFWGVRFSQGMFLMDSQYLEVVSSASDPPSDEHMDGHSSDSGIIPTEL